MPLPTKIAQPLSLIAGSGLGTSYSSLRQLGDILPSHALGAAKVRVALNVATGNVVVRDTALPIVFDGQVVEFGYIYNSMKPDLQNNWRFSLKGFSQLPPSRPLQMGDKALLTEEDGHETAYTFAPALNAFVAPQCGDGTPYLKYDAKVGWVWFHPLLHVTEEYDSNGRLLKRVAPSGAAMHFVYDAVNPQQLNEITLDGSRIKFNRQMNIDGSFSVTLNLVQESGESLVRTHHFNEKKQLLATEIHELSSRKAFYTVTYLYERKDELVSHIKQTDHTQMYLTYDYGTVSGKPKPVTKIYNGEDNQQFFNLLPGAMPGEVKLKISDGVTYKFNLSDNRITQLEEERGYIGVNNFGIPPDITTYAYWGDGQLQQITYPDQSKEELQYVDHEGKSYYGFIITHTERNGKITKRHLIDIGDFRAISSTSDLLDNGKLATTYHVYEEIITAANTKCLFERFTISPEGRVTEYRTSAAKPGLIETVRSYLDSFFSTAHYSILNPPTLNDLTDWVGLQHTARVSLTKFEYDRPGNVVTEIKYSDVNATTGVGIENDQMTTMFKFHDCHGNLRRELIARKGRAGSDTDNFTTVHKYDPLNRRVETVDPLQQKTECVFADSAGEKTIIRPDGMREISKCDTRGLLVRTTLVDKNASQVDPSSRETVYQYDGGFIDSWMLTHPDKKQSYEFYDRQRRLVFAVSHTGIVTQYDQHRKSGYLAKIRYEKKVDMSAILIPGFLPAIAHLDGALKKQEIYTDPNARKTYTFFDKAGRPQYEVDEELAVKEIQYNTFDKPTAIIRYKKRLTTEQLEKLKSGNRDTLAFDANVDRCNKQFYDADGCLIGEQDPAGYVTRYSRDAGGRVTQKLVYAKKTPVNRDNNDFTNVIPTSTVGKDARTYYFYDGQNRCTLEVDAEGYATTKTYTNDLLTQTVRHDKKMSAEWYRDVTRRPEVEIRNNDHVVTYEYDKLDREIAIKRVHDGVTTRKKYDINGQVTSTCDMDDKAGLLTNGDTFRGEMSEFDKWLQRTVEINPFVTQLIYEIRNSDLDEEVKQRRISHLFAAVSTRHTFDASGLKLKTAKRFTEEDTIDQTIHYFYDEERRPVVIITILEDKSVMVQENVYNTFGEVEKVKYYSQYNEKFSQVLVDQLLTQARKDGFITDQIRDELVRIKDGAHDVLHQYSFNRSGLLCKETDPENHEIIKEFNAFSECETETLTTDDAKPVLVVTHERDVRGLETTTKRQAADLTVKVAREFDHPLGKQTSMTDEVESKYTYGYDLLGRQTSVTNPDDVVEKRQTIDAFDRVTTETDAFGEVTAHDYERTSRTHTVTRPHDSKPIIFTENPFGDTIERKDALGNSQSWSHNAVGNPESTTDALQRSVTNRYDLAGRQVGKLSASKVETKIQRNYAGDVVDQIVDASGAKLKTHYERDRLGRATLITDPNSIPSNRQFDRRDLLTHTETPSTQNDVNSYAKTLVYNHRGSEKTVAQGSIEGDNQFVEKINYDALGRATGVIADVAGLQLQTTMNLDKAGKTLVETDPKGNFLRAFYDKRAQRRFQLDANGGVIEWSYNASGKIVAERSYSTAIPKNRLDEINDTTSIDALQLILQKNPADAMSLLFYDAKQFNQFVVIVDYDPSTKKIVGRVTEKRYDMADRAIQTILYAKTMAIDDISALTTAKIIAWVSDNVDAAHDVDTHFILDKAGQQRFIINPAGIITEQRFDDEGNVIAKITYAKKHTALEIAELIRLSDDNVYARLTKSTLDTPNFKVFNRAHNKVAFEVDAEGCVLGYLYDNNGNVVEECRYATRVNVPANLDATAYEKIVSQLENYRSDRNRDRVTTNEYNSKNLITKKIFPDGLYEQYTRDVHGNIKVQKNRDSTALTFEYDTAGRQTKVTMPAVDIATLSADGELTVVNLAVTKVIEPDAVGNNTAVIDAANTAQALKRETTFDKCNQPIAVDIIDSSNPTNKFSSEVVYNAKRLKVADKNEEGAWHYYVYDNQGKLLYEIDADGGVIKTERNTSGEIINEIRYATKIALKLTDYITTGISREDVETNNVLSVSADDQIKTYVRNANNQVESVQLSSRAKPNERQTTTFEYDHLGNWVKKVTVLANGYVLEELRWFDSQGRLIAEYTVVENDANLKVKSSDKNKIVDVIEHRSALQMRIYERNAFGEVEIKQLWANAPSGQLTPGMSLDAIKALRQPAKSDVTIQYEYNKQGQPIKETQLDVVTQIMAITPDTNLAYITDAAPHHVTRSFRYHKNGKPAAIIDDGNESYLYYNDRGDLIAKADVPQPVLLANGETKIVRPFRTFAVNAHGKVIATHVYANGVDAVTTNEHELPAVVPDSKRDQITHHLIDGFNRSIGTVVDPLALKITKKLVLDNANRIVKATDPNGNPTYSIYDQLGRMRFSIDGAGCVSERSYDMLHRLSAERVYAQKININQLQDRNTPAEVATIVAAVANHAEDSVTWTFRNNHGNPKYTIVKYWNAVNETFEGLVTEHVYDNASHEIRTLAYGKPIRLAGKDEFANIDKLKLDTIDQLVRGIADRSKDSVTHKILDRAGRERFVVKTIDAQTATVVEYRYDAFGRKTEQHAYANFITNADALARLKPEEIIIGTDRSHAHIVLNPAQDRETYLMYNAQGNIEFKIKPSGTEPGVSRVTRYAYDNKANRIAKTNYATRIIAAKDPAAREQQARLIAVDDQHDRTTQYWYDAIGNCTKKMLPNQRDKNGKPVIQFYAYDIFSNRTKMTDAAGADWKEEFDNANRCVKKIAPAAEITDVKYLNGILVDDAVSTISVETELQYDNAGNLKKAIYAVNTAKSNTVETRYDGSNELIETQLPGVMVDVPTQPADNNQRPEISVTVTRRTVRNGKRQIIVEQNESEQYTFTVYGEQNKPIYKVLPNKQLTHLVYDAKGNLKETIIYATTLNFNLTEEHKKTGIPRHLLDAFIATDAVKQHPRNRHTYYDYNHLGNLKSAQGAERVYVSPTEETVEPTIGIGQSLLNQEWNAFSECVQQTQLRDEVRSAITTHWYDRSGSQAASIGPTQKPVLTTYNAFGEEETRTEYAGTPERLHFTNSLAEVKKAFVARQQPQDRQYVTVYDRAGNPTEMKSLNVVTSDLQADPGRAPNVISQATAVSVQYAYTNTDLLSVIQHEDGSKELIYYNSRGDVIAKTGTPITNKDFPVALSDGSNNTTPFTSFKVDAHGQCTKEIRYANGVAAAQPDVLPVPDADLKKDQVFYKLRDNASKRVLFEQDAAKNLVGKTYTRSGKLARQWLFIVNYKAQNVIANTKPNTALVSAKPPHLDEQTWSYDELDNCKEEIVKRDHQMQRGLSHDYNTFNEEIGRGTLNVKSLVKFDRDNTGHVWRTNEGGSYRLVFADLTGKETLSVQSPDVDLSLVSADPHDIKTFFDKYAHPDNDTKGVLEKTLHVLDASGREIVTIEPSCMRAVTNMPSVVVKIPLQMTISSLYRAVGSITASWPIPEDSRVISEMMCWPKGSSDKKKFAVIILLADNCCAADISGLHTDLYEYEVDFYKTDANGEKTTELAYKTTGAFQVITSQPGNSLHVAVKSTNGRVYLHGNTSNLASVELYRNTALIGTFPINADDNSVDLSQHQTAIYQLKPVYSNGHIGEITPPFEVRTNREILNPIIDEVPFSAIINVIDEYAEINWTLPEQYDGRSIELTFGYEYKQEVISEDGDCDLVVMSVPPNQDTIPNLPSENAAYIRCEDKLYYINKHFKECIEITLDEDKLKEFDEKMHPSDERRTLTDAELKEVTALTGHLRHPMKNLITKKSDYEAIIAPDDFIEERTDRNGKTIKANCIFPYPVINVNYFSAKLQKKEDDDSTEALTLGDHVNPSKTSEVPFAPNTLVVYESGPRLLAMVTDGRVHRNDETITYKDVSRDHEAGNVKRPILQGLKDGYLLDITGMATGAYPLIDNPVALFPTYLLITHGADVFASDPGTQQDLVSLQVPKTKYKYDHWNNCEEVTAPNGDKIKREFNHRNAVQLTTYATTSLVVNPTGAPVMGDVTPTTKKAYNKRGHLIATTDARDNVTGRQVDSEGRLLVEILADGTRGSWRHWNLLSQMDAYCNSLQKKWVIQYDANGNPLQSTSPMGVVKKFRHNARNELCEQTNNVGYPEYYNRNALGEIEQRIEPKGQTTSYVTTYSASGEVTEQEITPTGQSKMQTKNFHGQLLWETDLSGNRIEHQRNKKGEITDQLGTSPGASYRSQLTTTNVYDRILRRFVPVQTLTLIGHNNSTHHLRYTWSLGLLVQLTDVSNNTITLWDYDLKGRRVQEQVLMNGTLVRKATTRFNALDWEVQCEDGQMTMTFSHDAVGNRRLTAGQLSFPGAAPKVENRISEFDPVNRVTRDGDLVIGYELGFRKTEQKAGTIKTLNYNGDGQLKGTQSIDARGVSERTDRSYHPIFGYMYQYNQWQRRKPGHSHDDTVELRTLPNENGLPLKDYQVLMQHDKNDHYRYSPSKLLTENRNIDDNGLPLEEYVEHHSWAGDHRNEFHYHSDWWEKVTRTYAHYNDYKPASILVHRHVGKSDDWATTQFFYDSNVNDNTITNLDIGVDVQELGFSNSAVKPSVHFTTTPNGLILRKWIMLLLNQQGAQRQALSFLNNDYFYAVSGHPLGSYTMSENRLRDAFNRMNLFHLGHGVRGGRGSPWTLVAPDDSQMKFYDIKRMTMAGIIEQVSQSYPPMMMDTMVAPEKQTFADIAKAQLGNEEYGGLFASACGLPSMGEVTVNHGQRFTSPQLIASRNNAQVSKPYADFRAAIIGGVHPYLPQPEPEEDDESFFESLVHIVTAGVALLLVAPLGPIGFAIGSLSLGVTGTAIATGVAAGFVNAFEQGVLKGIGVIKHFSGMEVLTTAVSAGTASFFAEELSASTKALEDGINWESVSKAVLVHTKMAVTSELSNMLVGKQREFNLERVAMDVLKAVAAAKASSYVPGNPTGKMLASTATSFGLQSLHDRQLQIQKFVAQVAGNLVVNTIDEQVDKVWSRGSVPVNDREASPAVTPQRRGLTPAEERFIAETEAVTHKVLPDTKLDFSHFQGELTELNRTRLQRQQAQQEAQARSQQTASKSQQYAAATPASVQRSQNLQQRVLNNAVAPSFMAKMMYDMRQETAIPIKDQFWQAVGTINGIGYGIGYPIVHPFDTAKAFFTLAVDVARVGFGTDYDGISRQHLQTFGNEIKATLAATRSSDPYMRGEARGTLFAMTLPGMGEAGVLGELAAAGVGAAGRTAARVGEIGLNTASIGLRRFGTFAADTQLFAGSRGGSGFGFFAQRGEVVVRVGAENSVLRQRVLGNIAESKTARNVSNFAVYGAKENQIIAGYNADAWTMAMLKKGDIVYGGLPGQSAFYTSEKTLLESGYTKESLYQSLQVKPDPIRGFRPTVGVYEVLQDVRVPTGIIKANPHLGVGGGEQYFINNFGSSLKLNKTFELGESYEYLPSYRPGR